MYSSYEQTDRSSRIDDNYESSSTIYRSTMSPRITNVQRSRPTGLNSSGVSTRIYRNYISNVTTNNFGPGLSSLVHSSGIPLRTTSTAVVNLNTNRQKEKRDLENLNDKFAQYVEKVRFLEANNRKLAMEIDALKNRSDQGSSRIREMYDIEIHEANKLIDDTKRDTADIYQQKQQAEQDLLRERARYNNIRDSRDSDRRAIDNLHIQIAENEAQIALFRRRMNDLDDESRRYKAECQRLSSEISRVQKEIQNELFVKSSSEIEKLAVEDELINLRQIHESDLAELRSQSITNDLDPSQFFSNELSEAIREIRADYESILQSRRNELQNHYSILVNEFIITTQQRDPNPSFDDQQRRQVERTRQELVDTQNQNNLLRNRNQEMINRIAELQRQIKDTDVRERAARIQAERNIAEERRRLSEIERTYNEATTSKTTLEKEISTYRNLLESPNGLRDFANRVVQNAERDVLNRSITSQPLYNRKSNYSEVRTTTTTSTTSHRASTNSNQSYLEPTNPVVYRTNINRPTSDIPTYSRTIPIQDDTNYSRVSPIQDDMRQYRSTWNSIISEPNQQNSIIEDNQELENNEQDNQSTTSSSSSSDESVNDKQENPVYETLSDN